MQNFTVLKVAYMCKLHMTGMLVGRILSAVGEVLALEPKLDTFCVFSHPTPYVAAAEPHRIGSVVYSLYT